MSISNFIFDIVIRIFIFFGIVFRVLRWDDNPHPQKIKTRIKYLFEAAKKRKIKISILKTPKGYSRLCLAQRKQKKIIFETLPSVVLARINPEKIDNKFFFKKYLAKFGLPVPIGQKFLTFWKAQNYAQKIGYPVVVKPLARSISQGVTINIQNDKELKQAIKEAKKFQSTFLVEKYIPGKNFRVMIVGRKIFASLRKPAMVRGDGYFTIAQLIRERNQHKLRGPIDIDGWTLRRVDLKEAEKFIAKSGLNLNDRPRKGKLIKLTDKINLGSGADIIDKTEKIHPENLKKFRKISRVLKAPIIGLDIIMDDISKPWNDQTFYLIEANTLPSIDMHHQPLRGKSKDVAGEVWDLLIRKKFL